MIQGHGEMREIYPAAGEAYRFRIDEQESGFTFDLEDGSSSGLPSAFRLGIESRGTGEGLCKTESGRTHPFAWAWAGSELHLWLDGALYVFQRAEARRRSVSVDSEAPSDILAPMPGAVLDVLVSEGDRVELNQTLVIMESMKMELVITAPCDAVVRRVSALPGQQVERGMRLLLLAPESGSRDC